MIRDAFDALLCDLDGVVYRGDVPVIGAADAIERLREDGVKLLFCTNNSRSTAAQYVEKLGAHGVVATREEILTSGMVTADVLKERGFAGTRAIVVGGEGLRENLSAIGVDIDDDPDATEADIVVVGWDPGFDFVAMKRAALAVRGGATFVATNDDASFPAANALLWPGAGALLASIEVASGRRAEVMGKPHDPMMAAAAARFGDARHIAVVGDRPDTDLAGGRARGWTTILVLTGVTTKEQADALQPAPDLVLDSLVALVDQ